MKEVKTPLLLIVISFTKTIWRERCLLQFENRRSCKPVMKIIEESNKLGREIDYVATYRGRKEGMENAVTYLNLIEVELEKELSSYQFNRRRMNEDGDDGSTRDEFSCPTSIGTNTEGAQTENTSRSQCANLDQLQHELENLGFT
ncbi:hypothetical protein R1flu_010142 [Riccia fluitans]|uniref:Uncharacterized protein n=1 Tax=Riccia fluitans TaxID=41844 RepID=A0ABD1Z453_9MARC